MKITHTQGAGRYLLTTGTTDERGMPLAQVIDTTEGRIYPPMFIESILARGYWRDCDLTDAEQGRILASVNAPVER